ncbi:hypothetical protein [Tautonia plasticadhaerens]|uniref:Uncharacterized protein n=1 Tax=Tautonia plasticadhaerens TaxID=2527974 RepID=A0A518H016_9BACT|nr:hypothetical protein [Tautonia plasticadhaerens]QDV34177.1 hypothetical protein ElP_20610 [Tautonia plasticadhaerens]
MDDTNPYLAPSSAPSPRPPSPGRCRGEALRRLGWWILVFPINLPLGLLLGSSMTDREATIGMGLAVTGFGLLGTFLCTRPGRVAPALLVGGAVVSASQFVWVLHVIAGSIGLAVGSRAGVVTPDEYGPGEVVGVPGGLLVTAVTGALLMGVAVGLGLLAQVLTPPRWWGFDPAPDPPTGPSDPAR